VRHLRIPSNPLQHLDVVVDFSSVRDDRQLRLIGFQPGPAGISTGLLADGVRIAVDYADPRRVCFVTADLSLLATDLSCLGRLLGTDSRHLLRDEVENAIEYGERRRRFRVQLGDERFRQASAPDPLRRDGGEFGTFIHLLSDISGRDEPRLVRAVAAVDAFEQLDSSRQHQLLKRDTGDSLIRFMTSAIRADVQGPAVLSDLDGAAGEQLVELLGRASQIGVIQKTEYGERLRWSSSTLRGMMRDADTPESGTAMHSESPMIAAAPSLSRPSPPPRRPSRQLSASRDSQAGGPPKWHGVPELTSPGRLRIRWVENPGHIWIRVLDRSDLHLISIAPIRQYASHLFECEAIIPPDHTLESISCELADEPSRAPRPTVEIVEDAVEAGQLASRLSAHDAFEEAERQWQVCAELWEEAGDTTRSNLARAYGSGDERVQRSAFLHDTVRDLISDD